MCMRMSEIYSEDKVNAGGESAGVLQNFKCVCFPREDYFRVQELILQCDLPDNSQYPAVTEEIESILQKSVLMGRVTSPRSPVKLRIQCKVCPVGEEPPRSLIN